MRITPADAPARTMFARNPSSQARSVTASESLAAEGLLANVDEAVVKEVIAWQVAQAMRERGLSKTEMAGAMQTRRTQLNRLRNPSSTGVALHTL